MQVAVRRSRVLIGSGFFRRLSSGPGGFHLSEEGGAHLLSVESWQELYKELGASAPPLRFPVGTPVRCRVGDDRWVSGTVVNHNYRETSWPAEVPSAPYQILVDDKHIAKGGPNAIWAPADVDMVIRSNFRFPLKSSVECRVGEDEYVVRKPDCNPRPLPGSIDSLARGVRPHAVLRGARSNSRARSVVKPLVTCTAKKSGPRSSMRLIRCAW